LFEIRVHGLGGQGAVTLVNWLAQAGYSTGQHVQAFPFFGAERRGAPVKAFVRVDSEAIDLRSQVYLPDLLVVMSTDLTGVAISEGIKPEGKVLVNAGEELADRLATRFAREIFWVDATGIALELGLEIEGMPMVNLPLFGAMASQSGTSDLDAVLEVVNEVAAKRGNREAYVTAATRGFNEVYAAEPSEATVK
jgi:2-oxoacid:acceptor oxidoreductase gamma subunit (pyruvate/2-ketoisovalerate family)